MQAPTKSQTTNLSRSVGASKPPARHLPPVFDFASASTPKSSQELHTAEDTTPPDASHSSTKSCSHKWTSQRVGAPQSAPSRVCRPPDILTPNASSRKRSRSMSLVGIDSNHTHSTDIASLRHSNDHTLCENKLSKRQRFLPLSGSSKPANHGDCESLRVLNSAASSSFSTLLHAKSVSAPPDIAGNADAKNLPCLGEALAQSTPAKSAAPRLTKRVPKRSRAPTLRVRVDSDNDDLAITRLSSLPAAEPSHLRPVPREYLLMTRHKLPVLCTTVPHPPRLPEHLPNEAPRINALSPTMMI